MRIIEFLSTPMPQPNTELNNKTLIESLDGVAIDFLNSLSYLSSDPIIGNKYIPINIMLFEQNDLHQSGIYYLVTLEKIKFANNLTIFEFVDNHGNLRTYPSSQLSDRTYTKLFLFDNQLNFEKFKSAIILKFGKSIRKANFE